MKKLMLIAAIAALGACTQVDAGNAAVKTHYGVTEKESFGPGFYWYNPWATDIISMNTQQRKWGDTTETYTRDVQKADVNFVLNYHLRPDHAHIMYQRVGEEWADNILPQTTIETIKNELGRVDAVTLVATRGEVADRIYKALRAKLAAQDVVLDSFDLTDVKYTGAFEHAVEQKQVAIQTAIAEQNNTVKISEQAKQAVITAKGNAEALQVTSQALQSNPKLIEYEAIKKWDGVLPTTTGGAVPFVNVGGK